MIYPSLPLQGLKLPPPPFNPQIALGFGESPKPILIFNGHGICVWANDAAIERLGEVIGLSYCELPFVFECQIRRHPVEMGLSGLRSSDRRIAIVIQCHIEYWRISSWCFVTESGPHAVLEINPTNEVNLVRQQREAELRACLETRMVTELALQTLKDEKTEAWNARAINHNRARLEACARAGEPVIVAMVDFDGLKSINEQFGHDRADEMLQAFVRSSLEHLRLDADLVVRFGGDEFAIITVGLSFPEAVDRFDRIRCAALQLVPDMPTSVTIGAAQVRSSLAEAISEADARLFAGKHGGRNCIVACARSADYPIADRNMVQRIPSHENRPKLGWFPQN